MQKKRKKRLDVAGRVDFRRPRKFASGVVKTLEPSWSLRANLPKVTLTWLACAQVLVFPVGLGCQPAAPVATPGAAHFEIPVARQPAATPGASTVAPTAASAPRLAPALPEKLPARFARQQACAQGPCSLDGWLPDPTYAESPFEAVSAQAAIWVHVLGAGAKLRLPPNAALELVVVCLGGELGVRDTM